MVDLQTLTTMFGGISLGVAAIYYMMNMRNSAKVQRSQLVHSAMAMNTHTEYLMGVVDCARDRRLNLFILLVFVNLARVRSLRV